MTEVKQLSKLAETILQDPILLRKLGDRIFELMQEDIRNQRDRAGYSRRRF
ncbi:MAG: hypothetical protein F6K04_14950 [Leptolyngbya sp. SIO4C5]|nr:hypothetical protein [Leptolyngbya sp. SIO4C5]